MATSAITGLPQIYKQFDYHLDPFDSISRQCEKLRKEVEFIRFLHQDFKKCHVKKGHTDIGLQNAIQNEKAVIRKVLEGLPQGSPHMWQVWKRHDLRTFISEMTSLMSEARDRVNRAIMHCQFKTVNQLSKSLIDGTGRDEDGTTNESGDTSSNEGETDNHELQETASNHDPPTFTDIADLKEPRNVLTFENEIFVLMDNYVRAYDMEGDEVKRFFKKGLKPLAGDFLDNTLYVTDSSGNCIIMFDKSLNFIHSFGGSHLSNPGGITACEKSNCIYVLTGRVRGSAVVAMFAKDGTYVRQFCHYRLEDPWYIKKNKSGEFVISDFARKAIDVYSSDFTSVLYSFDTHMPNQSNLHCRGMDVDDMGNIYVSLRAPGMTKLYESLVKYSSRGQETNVLEESPAARVFNKNKSLNCVRGLHYYRSRTSEYLMVVDAGNNRVKILSL